VPETTALVSADYLHLAGPEGTRLVPVGSADWWSWLDADDTTSFRFEHPDGAYSARRESRPSGVYWYAYSRRGGRLLKAYLGRGADLTPARLADALSSILERASGGAVARAQRRGQPTLSDPLLATRLLVPPTTSSLVCRQRLLDLLDSGARGRLTLLSAPAGFGKTALLADWASRRPGVAWLTLDSADNDPTRFWSYVVAALQRLSPRVGVDALSLFRAPQPPPVETILATLINDLAALSSDVRLVLDDYHLIADSSPIHAGVAFLIEHLPPNAHLLIASRADPPLPLARLRTRGAMTEVRLADLRFTTAEAGDLLNGALGLHLSSSDVSALTASTEGWPAGLQLAALSVRSSADASALIARLSGSNRYILDYLADEVLLSQPTEVQRFLLRTSVLDLLTAPLCEAICGGDCGWQGAAQDMLEHLERSNLFIVPIGADRRWYRYHRLFSDVLRERLARTDAGAIPELHLRAARWYADNGMPESAIVHALSSGDMELAADLVSRVARQVLMRSEVATLTGWLSRLPERAIASRPRIGLSQAWSVLATGADFTLAMRRIAEAERSLESSAAGGPDGDDPESVRAESDTLRAMVALIKGDLPEALELAQRTLARLPNDSFVRAVATMGLTVLYTMTGDLETATRLGQEAVRAAIDSDNLMIAVMSAGNLAEAHTAQGRLREAAAAYRHAERLIADSGGHELPAAGIVDVGLGGLLLEWNDLPTALEHLMRGVQRCRRLGEIVAFDGTLFLARARQAMGDPAGALDALAHAYRLAHQLDSTQLDDATVALQQARIWLLQGNVEAATRWAEDLESPLWHSLPVLYAEMRDLTHARVELARARPDAALALVEPLLEPARRAGRGRTVIEATVVAALALTQRSETPAAIARLEDALLLAEPEGYIRVFADEGEPLADLLEALLRTRRQHPPRPEKPAPHLCSPAYVRTLLTAMGRIAVADPTRAVAAAHPLAEPLSVRELEVLRLIEDGRSNRQIADTLVIAETTAKWHVANILGKLGVRSRTQAIARARELRLTD